MTATRVLVAIVVLVVGVLALRGLRDDEERTSSAGAKQEPAAKNRQTLRDPRGDVLDRPAAPRRKVTSQQLDLLEVTLARKAGSLRVSFLTAAPPGPGMVQVVETFDEALRVAGMIEIRHRRDGTVRAVARPPRGTYKPVPVKIVGREAVVRAPLNEYTAKGGFKWRAHTVSTTPAAEIRDRVPTRVGDVELFPGRIL